VSNTGGNFPRWRGDGKELFYEDSDGHLIAVSVSSSGSGLEFGAPRPLFQLPTVFAATAAYDVAPDGKRILGLAPAATAEPVAVIVNWPAMLKR
jgi:hypothetical protein